LELRNGNYLSIALDGFTIIFVGWTGRLKMTEHRVPVVKTISLLRVSPWLVLPLVLLLVAGCVTIGSKYKDVALTDNNNAMVLIYRPKPPKDIFLTHTYEYTHAPNIYHEGSKLTGLNINAYTYAEIEPGLTTFSARDKLTGLTMVELEIDASPGQFYYVRYDFDFMAVDVAYKFKIIPDELALQEIRKTRYTAASR